MRRTLLLTWLGCAGCPEIEQITYRFDLRGGRGTLVAGGIGTSEPVAAARDFAALVNEYLLGDRFQSDHPGWTVTDRKLFEQDGRLDGRVEFTFPSPYAAGLYQADKKSGYLWCTGEGTHIVSTNGRQIPLYPQCVIFDRKLDEAVVTVSTIEPDDAFSSLLPAYQRWDGGPIGMNALLSDMLSDVVVPAVWSAAGLPLAGGTVVFAAEDHLEITHPGNSSAALARYAEVLGRGGATQVEAGEDRSVWEKGGERWYISATQAGQNALVSIRRRPMDP